MSKQVQLKNGVLLVHGDGVGITHLSTFFVVAHGTQLGLRFGIDQRITLFFPWGVGQFGWYDAKTGFLLYDIMMKERQGVPVGLTKPARMEALGVPNLASSSNKAPLLNYDGVSTPDIDLVADDLNGDFCAKMLDSYYRDVRAHGDQFPTDIGVVCLSPNVTKKLSEVLAQLLTHMVRYTDLMVYCLCCSVQKGGEHTALIESKGYVRLNE